VTRVFDKMIQREIDTANDHLPKETVALCDLIRAKSPHYVTRGGGVSVFRTEEIEMLSGEVPVELQCEVRLPIVVLRRTDLGPGIFTVAGGRVELFLVQRTIIGRVDLGWDKINCWKPIDIIVRRNVQTLRRRLPSTTCLGFTLAPEAD
jgi:uncharacterized protein (UPF0216 family)